MGLYRAHARTERASIERMREREREKHTLSLIMRASLLFSLLASLIHSLIIHESVVHSSLRISHLIIFRLQSLVSFLLSSLWFHRLSLVSTLVIHHSSHLSTRPSSCTHAQDHTLSSHNVISSHLSYFVSSLISLSRFIVHLSSHLSSFIARLISLSSHLSSYLVRARTRSRTHKITHA